MNIYNLHQKIIHLVIDDFDNNASKIDIEEYLNENIFTKNLQPQITNIVKIITNTWGTYIEKKKQITLLPDDRRANTNIDDLHTNAGLSEFDTPSIKENGDHNKDYSSTRKSSTSISNNENTSHSTGESEKLNTEKFQEINSVPPESERTAKNSDGILTTFESASPEEIKPDFEFCELPQITLITDPMPVIEPQPNVIPSTKKQSDLCDKIINSELQAWPGNVSFQLPNASVGQAYDVDINSLIKIYDFIVEAVIFTKNIGLDFDLTTGHLSGIPIKDGNHDVRILFTVKNNKNRYFITNKFIINPDPRNLWKNIPSDQNGIYSKPDEEGQFIAGSDGFSLIAGSKRGRSHAQNGTFRDDDFFIYSRDDGWQIAVVSDGAGSAKYSRKGSAIICKGGGEYLEHEMTLGASQKLDDAVRNWYDVASDGTQGSGEETNALRRVLYMTLGHTAHTALKLIYKECELRSDLCSVVKDFSSTVLLSITRRFPFGVFCASFSVGDGAIGVLLTDGKPLILNSPDGGEYSGQTRFLSNDTVTGEELLKRLNFKIIPDKYFRGLFLMTDGISDPYFQTDKGLEMPERWAKLYEDLENNTQFSSRNTEAAYRLVNWLDFWSKGEHDDRTLAVIY